MTASRTRILVEVSLTIALCAVLHFVRIWQMPFGGSVSLEMLPIFVLALRRGVGPALVAGLLFGVVDYFLEPYVVHWVQFFLDYPIAFTGVGLAGLWAPLWRRFMASGKAALAVGVAIPLAVLTGALARFIAHFISGVVFFATVAGGGKLPDGTSAFATANTLKIAAGYSAAYNSFVLVAAAACLIALIVIMPILERAVPVESMP
jgi:thiamine transporter